MNILECFESDTASGCAMLLPRHAGKCGWWGVVLSSISEASHWPQFLERLSEISGNPLSKTLENSPPHQ